MILYPLFTSIDTFFIDSVIFRIRKSARVFTNIVQILPRHGSERDKKAGPGSADHLDPWAELALVGTTTTGCAIIDSQAASKAQNPFFKT
jgi:hypothetical protein